MCMIVGTRSRGGFDNVIQATQQAIRQCSCEAKMAVDRLVMCINDRADRVAGKLIA
jgi:hypothetical protein